MIQGGCNTHSANYTAYQNGTFSLGPIKSTKKACINDKDSTYTTALVSSVSYTLVKGVITLKNSKGEITFILTPKFIK